MRAPKICNQVKIFCADASGATLVEYGVALLVVIIVGSAAITGLASAVGNTLSETATAF